MIGIARRILSLGTLLSGLLPIAAIAVEEKRDPVPPVRLDCRVIDLSGAIIARYVGDDLFSKCFQFYYVALVDTRGAEVVRMHYRGNGDPQEPQYNARPEVYYSVAWVICFPNGGRGNVAFDMDTEGRLLSDPEELRLPRCVDDPESCSFSITSARAKEIGSIANGGHDQDSSSDFRWSEDFDRYVWVVRLWPHGQPGTAVRDSKMALVDPNTGEVLMSGDWKEQYHGWR